MDNKINTVLNAWYLLEAIQPKALPKKGELEDYLFTHKKKVPKLAPIEVWERPWQQHILTDIKKTDVQFHYYMKCYEQWELTEKLRMIFRSDEELVVKDTTLNYSFTFSVNSEGKYIEDSLFIPFVHYLLKELKETQGSNYNKLLQDYKSRCKYMEQKATALFIRILAFPIWLVGHNRVKN